MHRSYLENIKYLSIKTNKKDSGLEFNQIFLKNVNEFDYKFTVNTSLYYRIIVIQNVGTLTFDGP